MPVYEFECPKGHVVEDTVPMGTKTYPCAVCNAEPRKTRDVVLAKRILSPTRTTFVFADTGRRG
jgi:hypothetical protein